MFQLVTSPRRFKVNTLCDELATIQTTQKHKDPSLQKKRIAYNIETSEISCLRNHAKEEARQDRTN